MKLIEELKFDDDLMAQIWDVTNKLNEVIRTINQLIEEANKK